MPPSPFLQSFLDETRSSRIILMDVVQGAVLALLIQVVNLAAQKGIESFEEFINAKGTPFFRLFSSATEIILGVASIAALGFYAYKSVQELRRKLESEPPKSARTRRRSGVATQSSKQLPKSKAHAQRARR